MRIIYLIIYTLFSISISRSEELLHQQQLDLLSFISSKESIDNNKKPRIGLVLSGGGARGIAHIGVIKALEKHKIPIDLIVGSSMGSVIGGLYAAGYSTDQLERIMHEINWKNLFRDTPKRESMFLGQKVESDRFLLNIRFEGFRPYIPTSLSPGQNVLSLLSNKLFHINFQTSYDFDNLKIPFRALATDIVSGKSVVLSKGDLAEAINASIAIPLLFSAVEWQDMLLADGGLLSNLPVDVAKSCGMDIVIAIDITSPLRAKDELRAPWEMIDQITTIMIKPLHELQLKSADIVVKPDLEDIGSNDFEKIDSMINKGQKAVDEVLNQILQLIESKKTKIYEEEFIITEFEMNDSTNLNELIREQGLYAYSNKKLTLSMIQHDVDNILAKGIYHQVKVRREINISDTILYYDLQINDRLKSFTFHGNSKFSDSLLLKQIKHPFNTYLDYNLIKSDINRIRELYVKKGYALINFASLEFKGEEGLLDVEINEGIIDSIGIEGNRLTDKMVITREIPFSAGQVFNSFLVRKGIENIYNTQLFEKVNIYLKKIESRNVLVIKVKEKKYTIIRLGGKIDLERTAQSYFELANENIFGTANKISLLSCLGEKDRMASFSFRSDRIFRSYSTFGIRAYYDWKNNPLFSNEEKIASYNEERRGGRIFFGQQMKKLGQMAVEFRIENVKVVTRMENGSDTRYNFKQNSEIRTFIIRSITDKRDRIAFTQKGIYNVWYWESGNESVFNAQEKFVKYFIDLEGYYSYASTYTFHIKVNLGVADKTLPFSEYFRVGGLDNFIGMHDYEYFGKQIFLTNLAYRYRLPFNLLSDTYITLRYDIGSIWDNPDLVMRKIDLFHGIGAILGIKTIFGPLIIGYGHLNKGRGVLYLSLGYNF
jgi:NTE family protein